MLTRDRRYNARAKRDTNIFQCVLKQPWGPDSGRGSLSSSDGKTVGVGSTGARSTDRMEAKSEVDECRLAYEVSKVLQDKRKGTSVVGCNVDPSCDVCF